MATINPTLLIGLGGTGIKSLVHAKKMFIEAYGEVPPTIAFLGIDTNLLEQRYSIDGVALDESEYCSLYVSKQDALAIYNLHRDRLSWIPEENRCIFRAPAQCRTAGRFAFCVNRDLVVESVNQKLNEVKSAFSKDCYPEINVVSSLCGGTGAGMLIDMGYLLRQVAQESKIHCYAVGPDVFHAMANQGMERVSSNSFATLVDLDYLMSMTYGNEPVKLEYLKGGDSIETNYRPYDSVYFINNSNSKQIVSHIDSLAQMIGISLFAKSGDMGGYIRSYNDGHTDICAAEGLFDVENKRAWVRSISACEIVYNGDVLADIYRMKAAQQLISRLTNSTADAYVIANAWIDSLEVKIRENDGHDDVIDFIADATPQFPFVLCDKKSIQIEIEMNKNINKLKDEAVSGRVEELVSRVRGELRKLVVIHINSEGGIALVKNILNTIKAQVQTYMGKMTTGIEYMQNAIPAINGNIQALASEIEKSWFGARNARERLAEEMRIYNTTVRDIQRHNAAITVYNSILAMIEENLAKVNGVEDLLSGVMVNLTNNIAREQARAIHGNRDFQINLAADEATRIAVNGDEIIVADFVKTLGGEFKIYGLNEFSSSEVENMLLNYTGTLASANAYVKGVTEVLREMYHNNTDGIEVLKQTIGEAVRCSNPYIIYDYKGYTPECLPINEVYIGVDDHSDFLYDELNRNIDHIVMGQTQPIFASTGLKDRIIVLQEMGCIPVYAISAIERWQEAYKQSRCNHHSDANIQRRMESEGFSVYPRLNIVK